MNVVFRLVIIALVGSIYAALNGMDACLVHGSSTPIAIPRARACVRKANKTLPHQQHFFGQPKLPSPTEDFRNDYTDERSCYVQRVVNGLKSQEQMVSEVRKPLPTYIKGSCLELSKEQTKRCLETIYRQGLIGAQFYTLCGVVDGLSTLVNRFGQHYFAVAKYKGSDLYVKKFHGTSPEARAMRVDFAELAKLLYRWMQHKPRTWDKFEGIVEFAYDGRFNVSLKDSCKVPEEFV